MSIIRANAQAKPHESNGHAAEPTADSSDSPRQRKGLSHSDAAPFVKSASQPGSAPKVDRAVTLDNGKSRNRKSKGGYTPAAESINRKFNGGYIAQGLAEVRQEFLSNYYFSDPDSIDVVLGVVAGNHFDSDPLWIHLVSPPSSGKTELLCSIQDCEQVKFISDLTPNSLISGFIEEVPKEEKQEQQKQQKSPKKTSTKKATKQEPKRKPTEFSLLPQLDGKVLVTKDFTLIHEKPFDTRNQILGILRDVYDGFSSRAFGNSALKSFKSRFNYITGMTPIIDKAWSLSTLGERFLLYRIRIESRRELASQSIDNANKSKAIREPLQKMVKAFLSRIPNNIIPSFDAEIKESILDLAELLTICRTYVHRERNDELMFLPQPELAGRVAKQLLRVGQSVALVRGHNSVTADEVTVMKRIALDSLPSNRYHVLKSLWKYRGGLQQAEHFEKSTGLSHTTVRRNLEDLASLKVVVKKKMQERGNKNKTMRMYYRLSDDFRELLARIGGV